MELSILFKKSPEYLGFFPPVPFLNAEKGGDEFDVAEFGTPLGSVGPFSLGF